MKLILALTEKTQDFILGVAQGKTLVATSNAMLKSAQLELEHTKLIGKTKVIKFLETE